MKERVEQSTVPGTKGQWELPGESCLSGVLLRCGGPGLVARLIYSNLYDRVPGLSVSLRIGALQDPTPADGVSNRDDWLSLAMVEEHQCDHFSTETFEDPEFHREEPGDFPVVGPWDAVFEVETPPLTGKTRLEIAVYSPEQDTVTAVVLNDWVVNL